MQQALLSDRTEGYVGCYRTTQEVHLILSGDAVYTLQGLGIFQGDNGEIAFQVARTLCEKHRCMKEPDGLEEQQVSV